MNNKKEHNNTNFSIIIFLKEVYYFIYILLKQLLSVSSFDGHAVIYIFGFRFRLKLKQKNFSSDITEYGLNTKTRNERITVSLTTFPERINFVHKTIITLLKQTCKPDNLVLWLANEQFPNGEHDLPQSLLDLKTYGLTIKWCNDIKSYKKLIPALKEYPNDIIITFDDDIYYDSNIIELLYNSYLQNKNCISTNRALRLDYKNNKIHTKSAVYSYWIKYKDLTYKNSIIGSGGVLYPPHALSLKVFDEQKFMKLLPTQDDVWFWAMAVLNDTPIKVVASYDINFITVENTQKFGLCKINHKGKSGIHARDSFNKILEAYPEIVNHFNT